MTDLPNVLFNLVFVYSAAPPATDQGSSNSSGCSDNNLEINLDMEPGLQCPVLPCKLGFFYKKDLYRHIKRRHYRCAFRGCAQMLTNHKKFVRHLKVHNRIPNFCLVCGKNFDAQWKFNFHIFIAHCTEETNFQCHICGLKLKAREKLYRHLMAHGLR